MSLKGKIRKSMLKSVGGRQLWSILHKVNIRYQRIWPDEVYFARMYRKHSGRRLDFSKPQTFDEKQLWLKMYYRNPLCTTCTDKYLVREYIQNMGYGRILNTIYGVYDNADQIKWDELPQSFYLKTNHTSGGNVRCNDLQTFDKASAVKVLSKWLKQNYYYESREWNYKDIQPKIIAEAIIENKDKSPLIDYRFLCYEGKCEYVFVDLNCADETGSHREDDVRNVYNRDMVLLDVSVSKPRFDPRLVSKPENYDEMVECAENLSRPFPFCRVDLYNVDGRIIFGEFTFFHAGGLSTINPKEWAYKMGESISIDKLKKMYGPEAKKG